MRQTDVSDYQWRSPWLVSAFELAAKPLNSTGNGTSTEGAIGNGVIGITSIASINAQVIFRIHLVHYPSVSHHGFVQEHHQFVILSL